MSEWARCVLSPCLYPGATSYLNLYISTSDADYFLLSVCERGRLWTKSKLDFLDFV